MNKNVLVVILLLLAAVTSFFAMANRPQQNAAPQNSPATGQNSGIKAVP
ncbi:MAG TPA: hypothetical protein PKV72_03310 [Candidatus Peribacteria bacterium]|nr:hypothetical protein [Candidatus Peribacteria bacterium]